MGGFPVSAEIPMLMFNITICFNMFLVRVTSLDQKCFTGHVGWSIGQSALPYVHTSSNHFIPRHIF